MEKCKWVVKINHTYEYVDMYGDTNYGSHLSFIECVDENDAYTKANDYYDKTKDLYHTPLHIKFGCRFGYGKIDCATFQIKKSKLQRRLKCCTLYLSVKKIALTDITDSIEWINNKIV